MKRILNLLRNHRPDRVNRAASQDELFLFVHMPKTGGQSLRSFFRKHFVQPHRFIHLVSPDTENAHFGCLSSDFAQRPLEERMQATVILGHVINKDIHKLVPGKVPRHILFLREPAETLVSFYNYEMKLRRQNKQQPLIPFEEWYDISKRDNMMTRWLLTRFMLEPHPHKITRRERKRIQQMLRQFWFVGCTEHLDRDAPLLFERIGINGVLERANVSGLHHQKTLTLDTALRDRLRAENPMDVDLYEYWKANLEGSLARIRSEIHPTNRRLLQRQNQDRLSL
jgi:hypothetical protein